VQRNPGHASFAGGWPAAILCESLPWKVLHAPSHSRAEHLGEFGHTVSQAGHSF